MVVPCLNEEKYVGGILGDLAVQTVGPKQVIVVDSGSDDDTAKVAESFAKQLPVKVVKARRRGVAVARNTGAAAAKTDWIVFIDADIRIDSSFLQYLQTEISASELAATAPRYGIQSQNLLDRLGVGLSSRYIRLYETSKKPVALGWCIAVQRSVHEQIGGFDESMSLGEDYDYIQRVAAIGGKFRFAPTAVAYGSMRRYHQQGKVRMFFDTIRMEVVRGLNGGRIQPGTIDYEYGSYDKPKKRGRK